MSQFTIFDHDNVIGDDAWRIPLIRWDLSDMNARYHAYHLASAFDVPGNKLMLKNLRAEDVIIFTAMPEEYRTLRHLWLNHNRIPVNRIYMRRAGNHAHSADVKREMLHQFYEDFGTTKDSIRIAYDDRADVVAMYLAEGVKAELVSIHKVSAYRPPRLVA